MVDFAKLVRDDFINGTLIFVGSRDETDDIERTLFPMEFDKHHLVFKTHPLSEYIFFAYKDAHPDWGGEELHSRGSRELIVIPWSTVTQTVNGLSNHTIGEILSEFLDSKAYININATDDDIEDAIDMLGKAIDVAGVKGGRNGDTEFNGRTYIRYLYDDCFRNLFVEPYDEKELNASNSCGIGIDGSSIIPSVVYPLAYINKKILGIEHSALYTEDDFDEIFN